MGQCLPLMDSLNDSELCVFVLLISNVCICSSTVARNERSRRNIDEIDESHQKSNQRSIAHRLQDIHHVGTLATNPRDLVPKEYDEPITHGSLVRWRTATTTWITPKAHFRSANIHSLLTCSKLCNTFEAVWGVV